MPAGFNVLFKTVNGHLVACIKYIVNIFLLLFVESSYEAFR